MSEKQRKALEERIYRALVGFPWWNYGLDEIDDAEKDWARDLAKDLAALVEDGAS